MKNITTLIIFFSLIKMSYSQTIADTLHHNKNVLIEEFTGVQCQACPTGHEEIAALLAAHPNRAFAACLHSDNTGHTEPYPGNQDLRRVFPDNLWSKCPDLTGIPSGIISRRPYGYPFGEGFIFFTSYHSTINNYVNIIINEPSPFNIGIKAEYDSISKVLQIKSEVYTTISSTGIFRLNVYFTESNIIVSQLDGTTVIPDYNEKHVFREILTPTWGSSLATSTNHGNLYNSTLTFKNDSNYKMQNVEVIVFITDHSTTTNSKGVVVQSMGVPVTMIPHTSSINEQDKSFDNNVLIYPNPASNQFYLYIDNPSYNNEINISDLNGQIVYKKQIAKEKSIYIEPNLTPGVYILSLKNNSWVNKKIIIY